MRKRWPTTTKIQKLYICRSYCESRDITHEELYVTVCVIEGEFPFLILDCQFHFQGKHSMLRVLVQCLHFTIEILSSLSLFQDL